MKKTINGWLFNRIEKLGNKEFNHIGCEGEKGSFGDFLASFVPKVGMKRKVRFTIETRDNSEKSGKQPLKKWAVIKKLAQRAGPVRGSF